MASSPKVGTAIPVSGPAPAWLPGGGARHGTADQVEPIFGTGTAGVSGGWRPRYDDGASGGGLDFFGQYRPPQDDHHALFTPLVALNAAAFPASETFSDLRTGASLFMTDLMRGIGVYEFNMQVIAGTLPNQGSVINRFG